jgi:hypothetical protein
MPSRVVGFLAAAALLSSIGTASAKNLIKLTDGQLDKIAVASTCRCVRLLALGAHERKTRAFVVGRNAATVPDRR